MGQRPGEFVLWQLDRDTFNHIVKEAAQKKRARYDAFLQKVPLLAPMDAYERSQLADALKVETFDKPGAVIVSQGRKSCNKSNRASHSVVDFSQHVVSFNIEVWVS